MSVNDLGQNGLGQFEIIGAVIQAAGGVASTLITVNAAKYAAKQQAKAQIMVALAQERAQLEALKAQAKTAEVAQQEETQRTVATTGAVSSGLVAVAVLALLGIAGYVALRE